MTAMIERDRRFFAAPAASRTVVVRYGSWARLGEFASRVADLRPGDAVVVRTERGREWGEVLQGSVSRPSGEIDGRVLRRADAADRAARTFDVEERATDDLAALSSLISRYQAPLRAVAVERPIGRERIVYYVEVLAGADVAWRPLVDALRAREPETPLEVREVGERVRVTKTGCEAGGRGCGGGCRHSAPRSATAGAKTGAAPRPLPMVR